MATEKNNTWLLQFLLSVIWALIFVGWGGLCFWGYADLNGRVNVTTINVSFQSQRIATMEECTKNIKNDLSEIKELLKRTSPYERMK